MVLLPETDEKEAEKAAQRLCQAVAAAVLPTENGEVKITLSIGLRSLMRPMTI